MFPKVLVALVSSVLPTVHAGECVKHEVDFIVMAGDSLMAQIEDDIVADLAEVGITVNTRFVSTKDEFNTAMTTGDFNLCFTESWGPPYDPHTFASSWNVPDEAQYAAMAQMEPPMTRDAINDLVVEVLSEENPTARQTKWTHILQEIHNQAIQLPLWSRRVPAVWGNRLQGYTSGYQQYDYPVHNFIVDSGSTTITIAPAAQTGLFKATGSMNPHMYRPNEFFISNWMFESLVHFGENGEIVPALATSWTVTPSGSGEVYRFTLRTNVKFHDNTDWNCAAAKLNFDHVLKKPLCCDGDNGHGWYQLPLQVSSWSCDGEVFVVTLKSQYYPFLQELSFIRPLRMLSPSSFINGASSDPETQNSCPAWWGSLTDGSDSVTCAGISNLYGTGPWMFDSITNKSDGSTCEPPCDDDGDIRDSVNDISEVLFTKNPYWWGVRGNVEAVKVVKYDTTDAVKAALLSGALDVAVGDKALLPEQVLEFMSNNYETHKTVHGPRLFNQMVVMNAAKAPTDDINVRKTIMHALDKAAIVAGELHGQAAVADSIFPADAPYCDIDLTPRWDYDLEKAKLLNCPDVAAAATDEEDTIAVWVWFLVCGLLVLLIGAMCFFFGRRSAYSKFNDQGGQPAGERTPPSVIGGGA
jgi:ABC-type transport system substrate-binding protein